MVTANVRLARLLRRGGVGSVWCAEHLSLGTDVAVKFMSPHYVESDDLVARFSREATSAVTVLDFGVAKVLENSSTMTPTESTVGTPFYMSPEQLLGAKHVDFQCDLARVSTASAPVVADSAEPEAVPPVSSVSASATARPTPTSSARAP